RSGCCRSIAAPARSAGRSRWSSRTPTARSTRATRRATRSRGRSGGSGGSRGRRAGGRWRGCWRSCSSRRSWPPGSPTSSPAARSSASRSRGPWPATRRSWWPTSRCRRGTSLVFISHDLAVVRYLADQVAVMYLGTVAEAGPVDAVFAPPSHPYTEALLSAVPVTDPDDRRPRILLEGTLPSATALPRGCPFASRCPRYLGALCDETPPPEQRLDGG